MGEKTDVLTRMLKIDGRDGCTSYLLIVFCAAVCEVFLNCGEEKIVSRFLGSLLGGFERFGCAAGRQDIMVSLGGGHKPRQRKGEKKSRQHTIFRE